MQVYNHWGPVDEHKTLPTERLNELFGSMASYYKPPTKQVASLHALPCATTSGCHCKSKLALLATVPQSQSPKARMCINGSPLAKQSVDRELCCMEFQSSTRGI